MNDTLDSDANLRPIHYLGNKSRILDDLSSICAQLAIGPGPIVDLFAGTGVVARRLSQLRPVRASDIQEYSKVLTSALVRPTLKAETVSRVISSARSRAEELRTQAAELISFEEAAIAGASVNRRGLSAIIEDGSLIYRGASDNALKSAKETALDKLVAAKATILLHYAGPYFSYQQAADIDGIRQAISELPIAQQTVPLAALLGVASDIVSTPGNHFAQPLQTRTSSGAVKSGAWAKRVQRDRSKDVFSNYDRWLARYRQLPPTLHDATVETLDFRDALARLDETASLVYADPPYTRDHYSRFYHVLETIAAGDEPGVSTVMIDGQRRSSRALYRVQRHQSPFSIRTEAPAAFDALFKQVSKLNLPLVLSYSESRNGTRARPETRVVQLDDLRSRMDQYFESVAVIIPRAVSHSKLNQSSLNGAVDARAELLLVGFPGPFTIKGYQQL